MRPAPVLSQTAPGPDDILKLFSQHYALMRQSDLAAGRAGDQRYEATLETCLLSVRDGLDPEAFASFAVIDLAGANVEAIAPVLGGTGAVDRLVIETSQATYDQLAPALWAYMGGSPTAVPGKARIEELYAYHDPFGAAEWWDPSMMTRIQQVFANTKWEAALAADETGLLQHHFHAWLGPARQDWVPELRTPGAYFQLLLPLGEAEPAVLMIRDYIAANCAAAS